MKIELKMSGLMSAYLPAGSVNGRATVELPADATVAALMGRLALPDDLACLVIVNDSTVPKARRDGFALSDGDHVSIVPPLKGG